ncbi:hypothetical protein [Streptomyces cavourensis]|uniref:hypothetical protein n=1 Tax=Streptomyces cavourensis TaxID=67258 RepID=UPI000DC64B8C|nr:hypothetical protein [Streptomyces cavourensis]ATY99749.1 hypothetical protein CVT27_32705 [Streptomyces cavourensis]
MTVDQAAPGTQDVFDALVSLGRWRLRPGVSETVLHNGVHLRGWITSLTLEGGDGLPVLWGRLAEALAADEERSGTARAELVRAAPAGSPLRGALLTLIGQLLDHDLLVERSGGEAGGGAGPWLGAVADRPAAAGAALARSRARVLGADSDSPLARAAARALNRAGLRAEVVEAAELPDGQLLLVASRHDGSPGAGQGQEAAESAIAVAVGVRAGLGFVTPVGSVAQARADAEALAGRLHRRKASPPAPEHPALPVLLASSAAQRLVCAVAGVRDPSAEADDARLLPGLPTVLIAEQEPSGGLRGEYRSWPGPALVDVDRIRPRADVRTLSEALARIPVLTDRWAGVLDEPDPGVLPQLPAALVRCAVAGGDLVSGGARADLARLEAVCRAAELRLGGGGSGPVVVGAGLEHARGRALRRAVDREAAEGIDVVSDDRRAPVPWSPETARHPQAAHWWSVLVGRLGVGAEVAVERLGTGGGAGVFGARVVRRRHRTTVGAPPELLGSAVEATVDGAVAFAALSAVVRVQAAADTPHARQLVTPSGAAAVLARSAEVAPWEDSGWTTAWLAEAAGREPGLQEALTGLTGWSPQSWEPSPGADADVHVLWSALRQCGFTVLSAGADTPNARPGPRSASGPASHPGPGTRPTPMEGPR